ncbi:MAG TPA: hypothetical protein ENF34_00430 [Candidatus Bathyarchaeota archaeon]|nr:hypothetical protein [Candidatus Bathyarchaeota archaeon]
MRFLFFPGCTAQAEQYAYELSARRVLPELGVELVDLPEANCCGYPIKAVSPMAWAYLAGRVLAIAERERLDLLVLCNGCHLSFYELKWAIKQDRGLLEKLNELLSREGLELKGEVRVLHVLEVLHDLVGVKAIQRAVKKSLDGLRLSAHYGCHLIRPSTLPRPDDPEDPRKLEELIRALGASTLDYPARLDCCGSGLAAFHGREAIKMAGWKLSSIRETGSDGLVVLCPFCMKMLDGKQAIARRLLGRDVEVPVLYYTQLLGLAMGFKPRELGLHLNLSPVEKLLSGMGVSM